MKRPSIAERIGLVLCSVLLFGGVAEVQADTDAISALGRIEPKDGVVRVAGPSRPVVVVAELNVQEGDVVEPGQVLAVLDSHPLEKARVAEVEAVLDRANREAARSKQLRAGSAASIANQENAELAVKVARAQLAAARAELDRSLVRAPFAGQVLEIHARGGERLGPEGLLDLGRTDEMYAVAEVYETDINRVAVGQKATMTSPALAEPLTGEVDRVGLQIGKMDVLGTDPIAKTDARVVEVEIKLDDSAAAARLTNLQVKVTIEPR